MERTGSRKKGKTAKKDNKTNSNKLDVLRLNKRSQFLIPNKKGMPKSIKRLKGFMSDTSSMEQFIRTFCSQTQAKLIVNMSMALWDLNTTGEYFSVETIRKSTADFSGRTPQWKTILRAIDLAKTYAIIEENVTVNDGKIDQKMYRLRTDVTGILDLLNVPAPNSDLEIDDLFEDDKKKKMKCFINNFLQ